MHDSRRHVKSIWPSEHYFFISTNILNALDHKGPEEEKRISCEKNRIESSAALTSNGRLLKFKELITDEAHDEAGLSHGCIPKEDQLEVAYPVAHG